MTEYLLQISIIGYLTKEVMIGTKAKALNALIIKLGTN